ncbi:PAP/25A associated domain family protein [Chondrus crispus]|uniref:PAP/25A associated domain family protein n=1 Tax=Chondrus crispus TaxID=2769 RepID=R7Q3V3_CHOCR|nr:PAP/25A associated domain family protein [Chondrus crispus]CDF32165.1 PAP/25A associated domain family protein [Chondrus crispus]|eukprot:XP_005711830.1 PAP/25A associated domain family protein [Chondrus crispus]
MSWAAVVSGKLPEPTPPSHPPSTVTTITAITPTPDPHQNSSLSGPHERPINGKSNLPSSPSRHNRTRKSTRRYKPHNSTPPRSPASAPVSGPWKKKPTTTLWDDPRIVASYRLWTTHISAFMAQPAAFYHYFVINPQFQQSVFDAGLTFYPHTDPANPVLINLNSSRFGMAERINPLAPPPGHDNRPPTPHSPVAAPTSGLPISPTADLAPPSIPPQLTLSAPQTPLVPFLSPNLSNLLEAAKAFESGTSNSDRIALGPEAFANGYTPPNQTEGMENGFALDARAPFMLEDALVRQFAEATRIDPSDSESERLSEGDSTLTPGPRGNAHVTPPRANAKTLRDARWEHAERRRAGRRRVVSRILDICIPSKPVCKRLSDRAKAELVQQIEDIFPKITPELEVVEVREELLDRLRKVISAEWPGAGIDVYGSAGNGLGLRSADVDMSLYMPDDVAAEHGTKAGVPDPPKVILARLATIMEENNISILSKVLEARVPVIKMHDPKSKLQVDICVNNTLAVRNTELLKAYVDLDERFRYVCILVKLWAKRRDLNDAYHGTLSSYAYTLLVIHYLQTVSPPVLPCLQRMVNGKRLSKGQNVPKEMVGKGKSKLYNTYFDRTVTPETFQSANHTPVHELLLGFFRYFTYTFRYSTDLASIRMGKKVPRSIRGWDEQSVYREWEFKQKQYKIAYEAAKTALDARKKTDAEESKVREEEKANGIKEQPAKLPASSRERGRIPFPRKPRLESKHLFCIEDPFDIDHDLSRGMERGAVAVIREEMMRAYEMIAETGDFETACEEWM